MSQNPFFKVAPCYKRNPFIRCRCATCITSNSNPLIKKELIWYDKSESFKKAHQK